MATATAFTCDQISQVARDQRRFPTYAAGLAHLESVKDQCAQDPAFLARLGGFYFVVGRVADSEQVVEAGLRISPHNKELLYSKGDIRLSQGNVAGARTIATQLESLDSTSYLGPYLMQRALLELRQFADAARFGEVAIRRTKEVSILTSLYLNNAVASYHSNSNEQCAMYASLAIRLDEGVLRKGWGINEAIYALHDLGRRREALTLAKLRKEAAPDWQSDATLVKALKVMGVVP